MSLKLGFLFSIKAFKPSYPPLVLSKLLNICLSTPIPTLKGKSSAYLIVYLATIRV